MTERSNDQEGKEALLRSGSNGVPIDIKFINSSVLVPSNAPSQHLRRPSNECSERPESEVNECWVHVKFRVLLWCIDHHLPSWWILCDGLGSCG